MVLFLVGRAIASGLGTVSRGIGRAGRSGGSGISVNARLEGLEDLTRQLNSLGINFPKAKIRKAVNKGARLPLYAVKRDAPKLTGSLRKGIVRIEEQKWKRNKKLKKVVMSIVFDDKMTSVFRKEIKNPGEHGGKHKSHGYYPYSQNFGWRKNRAGMREEGKYFIQKGVERTQNEAYEVVAKTLLSDMQQLIDRG